MPSEGKQATVHASAYLFDFSDQRLQLFALVQLEGS